ncbi:hypothetical protein JOQ06_004062 [Pogonophryne albipinna]|uniref:Arf-GAP with coiled-coil, ANK repeat and PH domain-containing protein n=1 Tax=Pogonophryne albipinna TaxID=1090488 RepID=A0AAD6F1W4_9TELE|nr:hypothetical protein JOQ06_004062 [Pogonophryne albipinna]
MGSLGVHLSKVRSLTLDSWEAEQLKLLCILGNNVVNRIYEARCSDEGRVKPRSDSSRSEKEAWIKEKYVEKRFVQSSSEGAAAGKAEAGRRLYRAAMAGDLVAMAAAMAEGSEVNGSIGEEGGGKTPLIGAAIGGSLLACEFLLLNGAKVNHRDLRGQGALHAAATAGHTGQVCLLLKRGANQYAVDERGQDPLAIAVEIANADIVTLLRMARMNEEMRDSEGAFGAIRQYTHTLTHTHAHTNTHTHAHTNTHTLTLTHTHTLTQTHTHYIHKSVFVCFLRRRRDVSGYFPGLQRHGVPRPREAQQTEVHPRRTGGGREERKTRRNGEQC